MNIIEDMTITNIFDVITIQIPKTTQYNIIDRPRYGLNFCYSGKITYHHNGKSAVSDKNHAVLLPMGQTYMLECAEAGSFPLINFDCGGDFCQSEFLCFEIENPDSFYRDYELLKRLFLFNNNTSRFKSMALLYEIFGRLVDSGNVKSKEYNIIKPAVKYIEDNYSNPLLCNRLLADKSHISEVYFRKIFNKLYGITPKQYIQQIRIKKAKELLNGEYDSIVSVSEKTGYSSVYHFCRQFKKITGYSPMQYNMKINI